MKLLKWVLYSFSLTPLMLFVPGIDIVWMGVDHFLGGNCILLACPTPLHLFSETIGYAFFGMLMCALGTALTVAAVLVVRQLFEKVNERRSGF